MTSQPEGSSFLCDKGLAASALCSGNALKTFISHTLKGRMELERWLGSQVHNLPPPHLRSVKPGKSWVLADQNVAETESSRFGETHLKTGKVGSDGDDNVHLCPLHLHARGYIPIHMHG